MVKKTKNYNKTKRKYVKIGEDNYAPFQVWVNYEPIKGYSDLDDLLIELADRNAGVKVGSGWGGDRDLSFDFFDLKGANTFLKKARLRYKKKYKLQGLISELDIIPVYRKI